MYIGFIQDRGQNYFLKVAISCARPNGSTVRHINGHLRGPVTLTPVAEYLAVELSLTVLSRPGIEPQSPVCEAFRTFITDEEEIDQ